VACVRVCVMPVCVGCGVVGVVDERETFWLCIVVTHEPGHLPNDPCSDR